MHPEKALALVRCLRVAILGLTLGAIGAAWLWQVPPLAVVALVIAAEEMLEIGVVATALRDAAASR